MYTGCSHGQARSRGVVAPLPEDAPTAEHLFMVASGLTPSKENFFSEVQLSPHGGLEDVGFLFNPTRYFGALVGTVVLYLNMRNLLVQDLETLRRDELGVNGWEDPIALSAKLVAIFELVGLAYYVTGMMKSIVYAIYFAHMERARGTISAHLRLTRWVAITFLFQSALPNLRCFSAMKVLQYVVPAVFTPNLQSFLFRIKTAVKTTRRKALYLMLFIVGHCVLMFFGFAAFLTKFDAAAQFLPGARQCEKRAFVQIFLFANQVLGVLQLDLLMTARLFRFIFGGVDGWMTDGELQKQEAWCAAFHQKAWSVYGANPVKFLAVVLTFNDMDFQMMVIDDA